MEKFEEEYDYEDERREAAIFINHAKPQDREMASVIATAVFEFHAYLACGGKIN